MVLALLDDVRIRMSENPITFPKVGYRVWTIHGLHQHGPAEGPKTDVPADTGGVIVGTEKPYYTVDSLLYVVQWQTGQQTKHYLKELLCIGQFESLREFGQALLSHGEKPRLTIGPQGGFREFSMQVRMGDSLLLVRYVMEQKTIYESLLAPLLKTAGIQLEILQLEGKKRKQRPTI